MLDVEVSDREIHVVDQEKNEERIQIDGWAPTDTAPRLDRRVDAAISGAVGELVVQRSAVLIDSTGTDTWTNFQAVGGPLRLPDAAHLIQFTANVAVYVSFTGPAQVSQPRSAGPIRLAFDEPTPVTLGFRSQISRPRHTVTVPRSLDGAASAVRYLSSSIETVTPDKSYPTQRLHPPMVAFGERVDIPTEVYRDSSFSDVTFSLPRSLGELFVVSPLVYYLQADITLTDGGSVTFDAPTLPEPRRLGEDVPLEIDVADLLHRVFFLDCLVRNEGPYGVELSELAALDGSRLDTESLYHASTADRLRDYLELDYGSVRAALPTWHLSTVVEPTFEHVRALPHLLDRMSLVQLPKPVPVNRRTLVSESISKTYALADRRVNPSSRHDLVRNETRLGQIQGWLADGTPVDAFRGTLAAFENRFTYHERSDGPRTVLVVMNEDDMADELDRVSRIYRDRADELAIEVTVEERLTRTQLADHLRSPVDFLHYIGHCDESGLRCSDGHLSTDELDETRVQTFFLNACGSYEQGLALVERGSVAGAVTLHDVLNMHATKVATTFARLVMHGYFVEEALELARSRVLMSDFYTVVGDGTHRFSQGQDTYSSITTVERDTGDEFILRLVTPVSNDTGLTSMPHLESECEHHLVGNTYETTLSREELIRFVGNSQFPAIYENQFHWSNELAERLSASAGGDEPVRLT